MKTNSKYKIFHRDSKVWVIAVNDLPPSIEELSAYGDFNSVKAKKLYHSLLNKALSAKAVEVIESDVEFANAAKIENQLYDVPEWFEVNLSNRVDIEQVPNDERMRNKSGGYQVATIVRSAPVEAPAIEKQEELWAEAEEMIEAELKEVRGYGPVTAQSISYFLRKVLKSKYTLTRKP